MSYEVTATRRRPQGFDQLVGQEFVAATLKNAIQSGKIAHAYLFSGPRGCGKTSSARILAKALNCQNGPTATPCGICSACQEITRGASLDVIEIDGASNTSVNDIRQIKDEVLFPPNSCRYKIYIIDEVHMLSTSAFNALLKTIEEPPPYVIFVFATTELHKVPATIKSRCQQFNFRLVGVEQLKELLAQAAAEINAQADDEALYWIAREATGSVRDAYTLFDQVVSFSNNHITFEKIRDTLGLVGVDLLNSLCEFCVAGESAFALEKLDEIFQNGVSIEQFISNMADYLRSLLLLKNGIKKESLLGQAAERFSSIVLETWSVPQLERGISLFMNLYRDIRYSLSPRYETELAISRLCGLSAYVSNQEVKNAVEDARRLLEQSQNPQTISRVSEQKNLSLDRTAIPKSEQNQIPNFSAMNPNVPRFDIFTKKEDTKSPLTSGGAVPPEHRQDSIMQKDDSEKVFEKNQVIESFVAEENQNSDITMTPEKLRETVIRELSVSHALTASALMDSEEWDFSEAGFVKIYVPSAFSLAQLQKEKPMLTQLISSLSGKHLSVDFFQKMQEKKVEKPIDPQVEILCKLFKGTVN